MTLHPQARAHAAEIKALYGVDLSDLKHGGSSPRFVPARRHFWWLLKQDGFSLPRAARVTGHHHTTVLYGIRQFEARQTPTQTERAA